MDTLIKGANVFVDGEFKQLDIRISNGIVSELVPSSVKEISNKYIFPGFVDVHVHLREPGFSYKEDIFTGSNAAVHAGYTDICSMPNLDPVPDSLQTLSLEEEAIKNKAVINVHPYGSITKGSMGEELSDMEAISDRVVAFSDDGKGVVSDGLMREAFLKAKKLNKLVAAHCEFKSLMGGAHIHAGKAAKLLGIEGISSESEWKMIERDIALSKETGAAYHVCHVSTAKSVELIRKAKAEGVNITCETGPHYLLLDEDDLVSFLEASESSSVSESATAVSKSAENAGKIPADYKMNPPLRTHEDRLALLEAVKDGTIDMIATDHAPHSAEEKAKGLLGAPMGIVGLECAFPLLYTGLVKTGVIELEELVAMMSVIPAKRFGIESGIKVGATAKLCVYDLAREYVIDADKFYSKGRSTPFKGESVFGKWEKTIIGNKVIE